MTAIICVATPAVAAAPRTARRSADASRKCAAVHSRRKRRGQPCFAATQGAAPGTSKPATKETLLEEIALLGDKARTICAILPPEGVDRSKVDSALADVTGAWVPEDRDFCGEWRLLYANNGTVVTRAVATSASFLPRLSVSDVRQVIQKSPNVPAPALETTNEAVLGLSPLFSLKVTATGSWKNLSPQEAEVAFSSFSMRMLSIMGLKADYLPPVKIGIPEDKRRAATLKTTFHDAEIRIGEGRTGNKFVLRRSTAPTDAAGR